jgi:hypothetical protein
MAQDTHRAGCDWAMALPLRSGQLACWRCISCCTLVSDVPLSGKGQGDSSVLTQA